MAPRVHGVPAVPYRLGPDDVWHPRMDSSPPTLRSTVTRRSASRHRVASRHRIAVLLAVGTGAALGSVARYELGGWFPVRSGGVPWTTLTVNVVGSLALGVLLALVLERWPPTRYLRAFAGIGLCGGFTTWSTFMVESALLVRDDHLAVALVYLSLSVPAGLVAVALGIQLGRRWPDLAISGGPRRHG